MEMCKEMHKLRSMLDARDIKWQDKSYITSPEQIAQCVTLGIEQKYADVSIFRTHFEVHGYFWSVINGFGTYGGYEPYTGKNKGLLELMSDMVNGGEPLGCLTAEDVCKIIDSGGDISWMNV